MDTMNSPADEVAGVSGSLTIWVGGDANTAKTLFAPALKSVKPIPTHKFIPVSQGLVTPEPGCVVLACGLKAVEHLRAAGRVHKSKTVNALRETAIPCNGGHYIVTFDPGILKSEPHQADIIQWDTRLACRLLRTGSLKPKIGQYRWVSSFTDIVDRVLQLIAQTKGSVDVTLDLETMGFYPWYPEKEIISISITVDPGKADVLYLGPNFTPEDLHEVPLPEGTSIYDQVVFLLTDPRIKLRGSNLKFDLVWIKHKWGITCTNFKFDNMLVGSLLDENRSNSLNVHAKTKLVDLGGYDDSFNDSQDKGQMHLIPPGEDLLTYAGGDTDAAHQVADILREELVDDPQLATFYLTILHPAARAFEKLESRGVCVDQQKFAVLADELRVTIEKGKKDCLGILPQKMLIKYRDKIEDQLAKGKSPMTSALLKEFFFTPGGLNLKPKELTAKTQEPTTTKSHLKMFADVPEAKAMVSALTDLDVASKALSTFVDGFLQHLRPDGRLHPTYYLAHAEYEDVSGGDSGTVTGRLSAKNPPIQLIPKKHKYAKRIRECFIAPPGKTLISLDYSQGELRVVACVANEKQMIASYQAGLDMHAVTGAKLGEVDFKEFMTWKDNKDAKLAAMFASLRDRAKPANFGLLYGMGAAGFQAYAWASYGLKLTMDEAEKIHKAFFSLYPGLTNYHNKQRMIVKQMGEVRSPLGRVRHLPHINSWDRMIKSMAERQAINSPIQSTLSDMMLWAISLIEDAYPNDEFEIVAMIHDAMIAYVDTDKVQLRCHQAREIMANLPFDKIGWKPQLQFIADAEFGQNLASLSKAA